MATTTNGGAKAFSDESKKAIFDAILKFGKFVSQSRRSRRAVQPEILAVQGLPADDVRIIFNCSFGVEVSVVFMCIYVLAENLKTRVVVVCLCSRVCSNQSPQ